MNEQYNEFMAQLAGNPMLALQIGIYIASYSSVMVAQAVAGERAAIVKILTELANEHDGIDDEDGANTAYANAYRDAAEKVQRRG